MARLCITRAKRFAFALELNFLILMV